MSASVEYVADYMQLVYGQPAYGLGKLHYKLFGHATFHDGIYDLAVVVSSVGFVVGVKKLIYAVFHVFGKTLSHPRTSVLCGHRLAYRNKAIYGHIAPIVKIFLVFPASCDLRLGIVYKRRQLFSFSLVENIFEVLVNLHLDGSRRAFQHMNKGLMLSVKVA